MITVRDTTSDLPHNDSLHPTVKHAIAYLNFRMSPSRSGECGHTYSVILDDGEEVTAEQFFLRHPELC